MVYGKNINSNRVCNNNIQFRRNPFSISFAVVQFLLEQEPGENHTDRTIAFELEEIRCKNVG
jgi:hypothetical protein